MNYKNFPTEFWSAVNASISDHKNRGNKMIAAFDADGTLWDTDLGENFFQFQIHNKSVPLPTDPWNHYLEMKKINGDPRDAYIWLAQINKGVALDTVKAWSQTAFDEIKPKPVFSDQKKLIELFLNSGVEVYIVTASIKWAVEPGAAAIGVKPENVIGVETVVKNGVVTDEKILPITYRAGKVEGLLKRTGGVAPFFSAGNTIGDYELLSAATDLRLAVSAASRDDKLFKSENELQGLAETHGWWRHRFL